MRAGGPHGQIQVVWRRRRFGPVTSWVIGVLIAAAFFFVGYFVAAFIGGLAS